MTSSKVSLVPPHCCQVVLIWDDLIVEVLSLK